MNKKRLSVVMAGAMLASSVAPVLAATESELDSSKVGTLTETVYKKLISEVFTDKNTSKLSDAALAGKSVYYVKVNGGKLENISNMPVKTDAEKLALRNALQEVFKKLSAGDKVEIWSHGFTKDKDGDTVDCTVTEPVTYNAEDFIPEGSTNENKLTNELEKLIDKSQYLKRSKSESLPDLVEDRNNVFINNGKIEVWVNANAPLSNLVGDYTATTSGDREYKIIKLETGKEILDFSKFITSATDKTSVANIASDTAASTVYGFPAKYPSGKTAIKPELIETIKITGTTHNYKTEELYDGLMLTTEGHDLLSIIKEAVATKGASVKFETLNGNALKVNGEGPYNTTIDLFAVNSEYGFVVKVKDAFGKETVYTVKGAEKNTEILASWLYRRLARVDILAGDNRYETAVEISKEQVRLVGPEYSKKGTDKIKHIVLVNGKSLVDGLAAAPLAADLTAGKGKFANMAAPMLLTESDELPKATKAYLYELMTNHVIGNNEKATIHLVGGTSVLNVSLERELESMGFKVKRYNGDNREETSLAVAKKINNAGNIDRFVVGAEGEADAMSIAAVAAKKVTPIIVSKKGGLTYDALKALEGKKVTVLGGEKSVSAADFAEIKKEADAVRRIAGENRQGTNAAIINEYYGGAKGMDVKSVIVTKDGRGNNDQLVDALTAANLAVQFKAPVVLATNSLSDAQLESVKLRAKSAKSLFQIGHSVQPSVIETIAARLGLLNK